MHVVESSVNLSVIYLVARMIYPHHQVPILRLFFWPTVSCDVINILRLSEFFGLDQIVNDDYELLVAEDVH